MNIPKLFEGEQQEKFKKLLERLHCEAYLPYKNYSGGFATVEVANYGPGYVEVEVRSGYGGGMGMHMDKDLVKISMETIEIIR